MFACPNPGAGIPAAASNHPVPMEVDATRKRNVTTITCYRCGQPGHLQNNCPRAFDVRYMLQEERDEWIQRLLTDKDVEEATRNVDDAQEVAEDFGPNNE
jgi:hypothetical protein